MNTSIVEKTAAITLGSGKGRMNSMQTQFEFQEALALLIEDIYNQGYALNNPILYEIVFPPADQAGKFLLQSKEYLTFADYEEMLEHLEIRPIDAAFLIESLQRKKHTRINLATSLLQQYHKDIEGSVISCVNALEGAMPAKKGRFLIELIESFEKLITRAERMDEELRTVFPFTCEKICLFLKSGINLLRVAAANTIEESQANREDLIDLEMEELRKLLEKLLSNLSFAEIIVQSLKNSYEHLSSQLKLDM